VARDEPIPVTPAMEETISTLAPWLASSSGRAARSI
jgi:hypothetical protein